VAGGHAALATPFVFRDSGLRIRCTGKPLGFDALAVVCDRSASLAWAGGVSPSPLLGQLAGVHDEKPKWLQANLPVTIFHSTWAYDTLPVPLPWRLPSGTARFFEQQG